MIIQQRDPRRSFHRAQSVPPMLDLMRRVSRLISLRAGIRTPGKILRKAYSEYRTPLRIDDFDDSLQIDLELDEHMQSMIFWLGYYNLDVVPVLDRLLLPGMVVFDVGANIGETALVAARRVGSHGRVVAFEPVSRLAARLEAHCRANELDWITVVRRGLSDQAGRFEVYGAGSVFRDGTYHDGLATLFPSKDRAVPIETVEVTTLDEFVESVGLRRLDLIKIDIEGAELACLRGGVRTLQALRPSVVIELQDGTATNAGYQALDVVDLLVELGYRLHRIDRGGRLTELSRDSLQVFQNVLCVPDRQ